MKPLHRLTSAAAILMGLTAGAATAQTMNPELMRSTFALVRSNGVLSCLAGYRLRAATRNISDEFALENCQVSPSSPVALGALGFMARPYGGQFTAWDEAHCTPTFSGYRCDWKGLGVKVD